MHYREWLIASALMLGSTSVAQAEAVCEPTEMTALGGMAVWMSDINDWGQVVGEAGSSEEDYAFVWHRGRLSPLPHLAGAQHSTAVAINNLGQIVGTSVIDGQSIAVLWSGGEIRRLPGEGSLYPADINDHGEIVGTSGGRCVYWPSPRSEPILFGAATRGGCQARSINESGVVVGMVGHWEGPAYGFVWSDGVMRSIHTSPGGDRLASSELWAINEAGLAVGTDREPGGILYRAITWSPYAGVSVLQEGSRVPFPINDWGMIVPRVVRDGLQLVLMDARGRGVPLGKIHYAEPDWLREAELHVNNRFQITFAGPGDGKYYLCSLFD